MKTLLLLTLPLLAGCHCLRGDYIEYRRESSDTTTYTRGQQTLTLRCAAGVTPIVEQDAETVRVRCPQAAK
jgi:hypothetical protein